MRYKIGDVVRLDHSRIFEVVKVFREPIYKRWYQLQERKTKILITTTEAELDRMRIKEFENIVLRNNKLK